MNRLKLFCASAVAVIACGCTSTPHNATATSDDYDFVAIDETQSVGEKTIKLSDLAEGYEVVRFEDTDSALFRVWKPVISDNYILIIQGAQQPAMLFDRKGGFIGKVGSVGNGPGEYVLLYDAYIDEPRGAIFMTQMVDNRVLEYDLKGKYVKSHEIEGLNKAVVTGADKDYVAFASLAFNDKPEDVNAARLRPEEDLYDAVRHPSLSNTTALDEKGSFVGMNNEMWGFRNTPNNAFMTTTNDTLFAYDAAANRITPRAALKGRTEKSAETWYIGLELPSAIIYQVMGPDKRLVWLDKKTGKVSNPSLINDFCGNATFSAGNFRNGYFIQIWEPGQLADRITERWSNNDMTDEQRKDLTALLESIDPDSNDIMLIARLKNE